MRREAANQRHRRGCARPARRRGGSSSRHGRACDQIEKIRAAWRGDSVTAGIASGVAAPPRRRSFHAWHDLYVVARHASSNIMTASRPMQSDRREEGEQRASGALAAASQHSRSGRRDEREAQMGRRGEDAAWSASSQVGRRADAIAEILQRAETQPWRRHVIKNHADRRSAGRGSRSAWRASATTSQRPATMKAANPIAAATSLWAGAKALSSTLGSSERDRQHKEPAPRSRRARPGEPPTRRFASATRTAENSGEKTTATRRRA
jgi:hypothetical protein